MGVKEEEEEDSEKEEGVIAGLPREQPGSCCHPFTEPALKVQQRGGGERERERERETEKYRFFLAGDVTTFTLSAQQLWGVLKKKGIVRMTPTLLLCPFPPLPLLLHCITLTVAAELGCQRLGSVWITCVKSSSFPFLFFFHSLPHIFTLLFSRRAE